MTEQIDPAGDYALARITGGLVFVAGMTPKIGNTLVRTGLLGEAVDLAEGRRLAGVAAGRAIAVARRAALDSGASLASIVQATVFVAAAPGFTTISEVADGATAVFRDEFAAVPARTAVGAASLPEGAPVEVAIVAALG